ncbi:DNA polymerase III subunit delta' [Lonepinella koalarum]|uniref:DNA polymerase III subunit delta' n=1 Tax=Lonepinella koalarum TaxID=53417 RepID=A0A4R1KYK8_9PAST|nr:DNA polymerase III subunit delta' [Lonepinella koalarum]MDH2926404.1 DNA polymerase III subunit delta' [Lonepinella koalarum]TCK69660.1 DNA polymerase III delta prime subunit [Lonepinella koalarum]TFJ89902.1 DNA polymerase III subunit delta' [Lonepinella koalarum]
MTNLYPWLTPIYQQITHAFSQGHGHHALLFKAEQGVGAENLVNTIAKFLICQENQKPCGHCHACLLMNAGNHPDFHLLAPIENKDIGVDQVREINDMVNQHAQQNGNKVVLVQGTERLTEAAANAILKTLEEPRPNSYFLLQADLSSPLIATIYSRCQAWLVNVPPQDIALSWLQSQCDEETKQILTALRINYHRPLSTLAFLQQGLMEKRRAFLRQFWVYYIRRSPLELLPLFDKELIFQQIDWIAAFLSDALKDKLKIKTNWICQDLTKGIQQFNQKQTTLGLLKANQIIQTMRLNLIQINAVNQEIILLDGLTKLITEVFEK